MGRRIEVGDFVRGISDIYTITDAKMTKGIVMDATDKFIRVKIIEHDDNCTGIFCVDPKYFEVIGHQKPFNHNEVLQLLRDGSEANLRGADFRGTNLRGANLRGADLSEADFRGADLSEADLSEADLSRTDFREANLREANLRSRRQYI